MQSQQAAQELATSENQTAYPARFEQRLDRGQSRNNPCFAFLELLQHRR
jgi:hypothetical protein